MWVRVGTNWARGFGSIRQLKSGRFQARYAGPDGNRHKARKTFPDRLLALGWSSEIRKEIDLGTWTPPQDAPAPPKIATVGEFVHLKCPGFCSQAVAIVSISGTGSEMFPARRAYRVQGRAVCHETPSFGATAWHAAYIDIFSAKTRSSTRQTTQSFASWSNVLGIFQIFPSTQTEQNLGHFRLVRSHISLLAITTTQARNTRYERSSNKPYRRDTDIQPHVITAGLRNFRRLR